MTIALRCDSIRSWRARSMDAGLPGSRQATKLAAMPTPQRQGQSRPRSATTSSAMACVTSQHRASDYSHEVSTGAIDYELAPNENPLTAAGCGRCAGGGFFAQAYPDG